MPYLPFPIRRASMLIALSAGLLSPLAQADFHAGAPGMPPPAMFDAAPPGPQPLLHGIDLSDAQHERLFELMYAQMPQLHKLERARQQASRELAELTMAPRFDEAQAKAIAERLARSSAELALLRARSDQAMLQILTPEQRQAMRKRPGRGPQEFPPPRP